MSILDGRHLKDITMPLYFFTQKNISQKLELCSVLFHLNHMLEESSHSLINKIINNYPLN